MKKRSVRINGKRYKINYIKMISSISFLILIIVLLIFGVKKVTTKLKPSEPAVVETSIEPVEIPKDITVNLIAIGDIMCHNTNFKTAYNSQTKTYDFSPAFKNIAKYVEKGDIAIGNLETTFAGENKGYSGYPTFNSPKELGIAIKDIGVDVVSTANNHCMDKGTNGVINTLDTLDEIGIAHAGTNRNEEEQNEVLIKDVKGLKIAFLSYTYGTNGINIPSGKEYLVNLIDRELISKQIEIAKSKEVDLICASMHWGIEYSQKPNKEQEELADFLFKKGVDVIIGNHAHVIEPMEKRNITLDDGTQKEVFVVYALGNFISGQVKPHTKSTAILDLEITKNGKTEKISIDKVDYTPVYCNDKGGNVPNRYELLDIKNEIKQYEQGTSNITASLYKTLKNELSNFEEVFGN